jgi:hypothetical protein
MKFTTITFTILLIAAIFICMPAMADQQNGNGNNGNNGGDNQQPLDIDVNNHLDVNNVNNNYNENDNYNTNKNYNTNNNLNFNFVDVDQEQEQDQNQIQMQIQKQDQKQQQKQEQTIVVPIPQNANGILIAGVSNGGGQPTAQLDVGESKVYARLVYPGEVVPFEVVGGDTISLKAASDVGFYTIGTFHDDILKINSIESMPVYDPIYHKLDFGIVSPVDKINYWTTKATLKAGSDATYVVVDNRAPRNGYTHVEVTIDGYKIPVVPFIPDLTFVNLTNQS